MCVTCGCGGKKATVEELDQTKTHEHPHAETATFIVTATSIAIIMTPAIMNTAVPVLISTIIIDIPTGARVQLELRSFLRPRKKEWKKSTIVWSSWKLTF